MHQGASVLFLSMHSRAVAKAVIEEGGSIHGDTEKKELVIDMRAKIRVELRFLWKQLCGMPRHITDDGCRAESYD